MSDAPICPCETFVHPRVIFNPPGRDWISYRVGEYDTFRHALLLSLPGETELALWRPGSSGDLAVQMVEWWAYLADILTFYNERIATQSYLRTADLPESVSRLVRILGYRPRPGIGATGIVAALAAGSKPILLPQGFAIQSKPGPGKTPQVFEMDSDTTVSPFGAVDADTVPNPALAATAGLANKASLLDDAGAAWLRGAITTIKQGDRLLLVSRDWSATSGLSAVVTVKATTQDKDQRGKPLTRVVFDNPPTSLPSAPAADYRLLRSAQSAQVWRFDAHFTGGKRFGGKGHSAQIEKFDPDYTAHLVSLARSLKAGDFVLLQTDLTTATLVSVSATSEVIWYKNNPDDPTNPPATPLPPFPILHTQITFTPDVTGSDYAVTAFFDWHDVGELVGAPAPAVTPAPASLFAATSLLFPFGGNQPVIVEDAQGDGVLATAEVGSSAAQVALSGLPVPPVPLHAPLRLLFNLLSVSRGQTVANEVLGSGDASLDGQEFALQKGPLTYLPGDSGSGIGYHSTLRVWVNGEEWHERPTFYGQPPNAKIFVTREDETGKTYVAFASRLPTGTNNIVAAYRIGSGSETPAPGDLTVITQPQPNLKAIVAPVPLQPGSDPDPPAQIRRYAPQSVLTFGRAISADDYETIAAQAPGVARARSYWDWDEIAQRGRPTLYVGDDAGAVAAARQALALSADPNRPALIKQATAAPIALALTVVVSPDRKPEAVRTGVQAALSDPDTGLFGTRNVQIGQAVFESEIVAACLRVPGAVAVHSLAFTVNNTLGTGPRHNPGVGNFFQLAPSDLTIGTETATYAG